MTANSLETLVVSTLSACVGTDARTVMTRRLGKVESHFICKLAIGLFQISVLLILGMAIIEVTPVEADHLTGQVSFNFPVVCKSGNVKSA